MTPETPATIGSDSEVPLHKKKIVQLLEAGGLLSRRLKGFEPRVEQQQMMGDVIDAYNHNRIALIEAGTGTGKSMAYLIPALIWAAKCGERTVISTNTITLQEQLLDKDIPFLLKALNIELRATLVKGMNNYLCLRKLEDAHQELSFFPTEDHKEIERIEAWSRSATEGSRSEIPFIPSSSAWERVGAESEACSHNECPHYQQCYFYKARRQAQESQILVVNHHLLFSDLARRADQENYSESAILPPYKRVVLDEAHHIEDIATEYFASRLSRFELMRLMGKLTSDKSSAPKGKLLVLKEKIHSLFRNDTNKEIRQIIQRLTIDLPAMRHLLQERIHYLFDQCVRFIDTIKNPSRLFSPEDIIAPVEQKLRLLEDHLKENHWNEALLPEAEKLIESLRQYHQQLSSLEADLKVIEHDRLHEQTKSTRFDIQSLSTRLEGAASLLNTFFKQQKSPEKVRWIESQPFKASLNVQLVDADLDVSRALSQYLFSKFSTIVLCSATLTSNQKFSFFRQRLGLHPGLLPYRHITESIYDSPFNYRKQAILAVPTDMPPPSHADFDRTAFENIWKTIKASHGQAFVLFTSYAMMQKCHEALKDRLRTHHFPIFKQGDDNRQGLLKNFKTTKRAVLFGTDSFWEGVDVAGDALRCVIIVKLPFKVPSEPIIQARTEAILHKGGDPFFDFSVPHAIVKFKQGFGRLIRHQRDRGVIVCLDTRLVTKGYGKLFLNSLPPCEKVFMTGELLWPRIADFYRKTYHFVNQNPVY